MTHYLSQRLFFLAVLWAALCSTTSAQQPGVSCWDFEEACSDPADAFHSGCIGNAQSASGSPDNSSSASFGAFSGNKYAHMYANYCFVEPNDPNRFHCEGVILHHNFVAGMPVKISFAVRSIGTLAPSETKVILVNSMPNYGGIGNTPGCSNTLDLLPDVPQNSQTIATYPKSAIATNGWEVKTITFTPTSNFNQIWFRPKAVPINISQSLSQDLYLDKVCIENLCESTSYSVSACHFTDSESVWVNLFGSPVIPGEWTLNQVWNCNGGLNPQNIKQSMLINWLPGNSSFMLPYNTGCYILSGVHEVPDCGPQYFTFVINTDEGAIPECSSPCDDWTISMTVKFCSSITFHALPNTYFPSSTTFIFELDGVTVQSGYNSAFSAPIGPDPVEPGWHEVCVTVNQNGCPPIEKCREVYIDCFEGPGSNRTATNDNSTPIKFSNPSSETIWLSGNVESGTATLYSIQGGLVKSFDLQGTDRLDIVGVANGQYILVLENQDFFISKPLLIQH